MVGGRGGVTVGRQAGPSDAGGGCCGENRPRVRGPRRGRWLDRRSTRNAGTRSRSLRGGGSEAARTLGRTSKGVITRCRRWSMRVRSRLQRLEFRGLPRGEWAGPAGGGLNAGERARRAATRLLPPALEATPSWSSTRPKRRRIPGPTLDDSRPCRAAEAAARHAPAASRSASPPPGRSPLWRSMGRQALSLLVQCVPDQFDEAVDVHRRGQPTDHARPRQVGSDPPCRCRGANERS